MGFFTKLFKNKTNPDNRRLMELLEIYSATRSQNDYYNVFKELMNGNSFLMLPTKNKHGGKYDGWTKVEKNTTISLKSVVNLDGLRVLGAFTDEEAMLTWTKEPEYTSMPSQEVLKLCRDNGIDRIVVNTGLPNMFVLEHDKGIQQEYVIKQGSPVQLNTLKRPLPGLFVSKLIDSFRKDISIVEVYQYEQSLDRELSIVLGIKLMVNSENARKAAMFAVQNAFIGETLELPIDLFFIEADEDYQRIKQIDHSLLYKRES